MKKVGLLAILTIPGVAWCADADLCGDWKNPIEEDHRILESQLTPEAVEKAQSFLQAHPGKEEDTVLAFGVLNSTKIIKGYTLKRAAQVSGKPAEKEAFCAWLVKEGFWHD
jgi:hypothetical protein